MKNTVRLFDPEDSVKTDMLSVPLSEAGDWIYMRGAVSVPVGARFWRVLQRVGVCFVVEGMFEGDYLFVKGHGRRYVDAVSGLERQYIYVGRTRRLPESGKVPGPHFDQLDDPVLAEAERKAKKKTAEEKARRLKNRVDPAELPPLQGTPHGRAWAVRIRRIYFERTEKEKAKAHVGRRQASWWIRNRAELLGGAEA